MKIEMKTEYGGYHLEWTDIYKSFDISKDGVQVKRFKDFENCEKWIDTRNKKKFKHVKVIYSGGWRKFGLYVEGTATSIIDTDYAWVSDKRKSRSKEMLKNIWVDSPANRDKFTEMSVIASSIRIFQKEYDEIETTLDNLTAEMMEM